jgi:hypothetical protein
MTTSTLGPVEKGGLRKVSKETKQMDRRIQHARQLFNERIARAESEYYHSMLRAVNAEIETMAPAAVEPVAEQAQPEIA